jgi:MFS family permease
LYQDSNISTVAEASSGNHLYVTFSTRPRYLIVFSTAVLCYAALGAVLGILPDYVHSLGGGAVLVGFAVGAPALTGAAGRPFGGRLADHRGPPRIVIGGALLMAVGTIPAFVRSLGLLILSRLIVGAGEAMMMAATVLWLLRLAGPTRRGRAMGHIGLANYAGLTVGALLAQAVSGDQDPW